MAFEDYFDQNVLGDARDIGAESRQFQRSIRFIRQDRYKAGVLFYINEIQAAANVSNTAQGSSISPSITTSASTSTSSTSGY